LTEWFGPIPGFPYKEGYVRSSARPRELEAAGLGAQGKRQGARRYVPKHE